MASTLCPYEAESSSGLCPSDRRGARARGGALFNIAETFERASTVTTYMAHGKKTSMPRVERPVRMHESAAPAARCRSEVTAQASEGVQYYRLIT
ncbi:hypothetical protein ACCO45_007098 [Purpureocillium lilacinum]|uniref:Uncharacterized protein n=1 Tax=Purpureocillium lilacinum TaxID=33203 RepID=A0ACC4DRD3_PURLI